MFGKEACIVYPVLMLSESVDRSNGIVYAACAVETSCSCKRSNGVVYAACAVETSCSCKRS